VDIPRHLGPHPSELQVGQPRSIVLESEGAGCGGRE
jgi:hypothetical protein